MKLSLELVKKHPWITGAVVLVVGIGLYFILSNSGGGTVTASSSGTSAADVALAQQSQAIQGQLAIQGQTDQFQLAYLQQQQVGKNQEDQMQYNLAMTSLSGQLQTAQEQLATQLATTNANNSTAITLQNQQLQASIDINNNNNATAIAQQAAITHEQEFSIAAQNATQQAIATLNTQVATAQIGANVQTAQITANMQEYIAKQNASIAKAYAGASAQSSLFGAIGSIFGGLF